MTAPIVLLLSGPNLTLLGEREPEIYGTATLDDHVATARAVADVPRRSRSSTSSPTTRAILIEAIHGARGRCAAIVINPGAFTHYAWGIHDALAAFDGPVDRAAPVQPQRPRVVAPHVGGGPGGHRHHRRLRRARVRAGRRRRPIVHAWR